jgi:adenylate kinase family enzyme
VHERIAVVGCIGAGKSTLARALGERLRLPVVHLDRLWWDDGCYRIRGRSSVEQHTMPADEFRALQRRLAAEGRWIIDGGHVGDLDTRLPRATTVIWLDLPRHVCLRRLLRRHGRTRADYPPQVRESVRWLAALSWWVLRYPRRKRPQIAAAIEQHATAAEVHRLGDRRQVADLLARMS